MNTAPAAQATRFSGSLLSLLVFLSILLTCGTPARAQFTTARLSGVISDPSGDVLSGAAVTVQDLGTGYRQTVKTGDTGEYLFPSLPVGTYQLTVSVQGFAKYMQSGIALAMGESATQNVKLSVGSVAQNIVVTASPALVTTDSSMVGQLIPQRTL